MWIWKFFLYGSQNSIFNRSSEILIDLIFSGFNSFLGNKGEQAISACVPSVPALNWSQWPAGKTYTLGKISAVLNINNICMLINFLHQHYSRYSIQVWANP